MNEQLAHGVLVLACAAIAVGAIRFCAFCLREYMRLNNERPGAWPFERCKAPRCNGLRNCIGFQVDDDVWARVVPAELRHRVVCLECFDEYAQAAGVRYEVRGMWPVAWWMES